MGQVGGGGGGDEVPLRGPRRDERHREQQLGRPGRLQDLRHSVPLQRVHETPHPVRHPGGHLRVRRLPRHRHGQGLAQNDEQRQSAPSQVRD